MEERGYRQAADDAPVKERDDLFVWQANAFLDEYYPENFMGIIFDPEEMIRKFEAGVPLAELYKRPKLPAGMTPWDMHRP